MTSTNTTLLLAAAGAALLAAQGCKTSPRAVVRDGRGPSAAPLTHAASAGDDIAPAVTSLVCVISPTAGNDCRGIVRFERVGPGSVRVTAEVTGLRPHQAHGFHVHEYGDLRAPDATSAGGHFDPRGRDHGGPHDAQRHEGDLGNLVADGEGVARLSLTVRGLELGERGVLGRAVIVHEDPDDLRTQPTGGAGARIGAGVIGVAAP
ncbi:MAG: superoxide dismutase family protein [Planctomycetes bacterium]|nr:superoxide dismutase family protein [Planctomycetota bacterium]